MEDIQGKIGYLIAKVEEMQVDQQKLAGKLDALEEKVNEKFTTVETVLKTLKFLGLALVAVATFKFGDLGSLWSKLFGS